MEKKVQGQEFLYKHCLNGNKSSLGTHHSLPLISSNSENVVADHQILGTIDQQEEYGFLTCCNVSATSLIQEKIKQEKEKEELMMTAGIGSDYQDLLKEEEEDSYGLRENPKKSWKISDLRKKTVDVASESAAAFLCKDCEKIFPSSRALAGHMRAHSHSNTANNGGGKIKKNQHVCKKCNKGFESVRALYGHMKSHSNKRSRLTSSASATTKSEFDVDYPRKKRSVIRYNFTPNPNPNPSPSNSNSNSGANANSNSNSADFDEVEDGALCLMMLSRDFRFLDNSVEFDSNSSQSQSRSRSRSLSQSREFSVTFADEEKVEKKKIDSSSYVVVFSGPNGFENYNNDAEIQQELKISKPAGTDSSSDDSTHIKSEPPPEKDSKLGVLGLPRRTDQGDSTLPLQFDPAEKKTDPLGNGKKRGYRCRICNMMFSNHQALGGHSNRHKVIISSSSSGNSSSSRLVNNNNNNSDEHCNHSNNNNGGQNQKSKEHECAVCFKVFPTGQALGGHKRAHYAGFTENSKSSKENNTGGRRNDHQQEEESTELEVGGDLTHCGEVFNAGAGAGAGGSSHCCSLSLCN